MPLALIHHLTSPGQLTQAAVVCGDPTAAVATWDEQRVTCPACQASLDRRPGQAGQQERPHGGTLMHAVTQHVSEKELLAILRAEARRAAFLTYHPLRSHGSESGWVDLVCVKGDRLVLAELKSATGRLTPAQAQWLDALRQVTGPPEVYLWTPAELAQALEVLR